jgi:hypothetical protein
MRLPVGRSAVRFVTIDFGMEQVPVRAGSESGRRSRLEEVMKVVPNPHDQRPRRTPRLRRPDLACDFRGTTSTWGRRIHVA